MQITHTRATHQVLHSYISATDAELLDPHVYQIAKAAYEAIHTEKMAQSVVISGESGAGKTECMKVRVRERECMRVRGRV